jgi:pimeloyl-ACP methyl ester carboxylesterase
MRPAVIYLHGNASCQLEGASLVSHLCPQGVSLLCIDCSGSGNSDGEYIGLGVTEQADVEAAIQFLKKEFDVRSIVLWGRSMGAFLCLNAASSRLDICGIIADSSFLSVDAILDDFRWSSWLIYPLITPLRFFLNRAVRKCVQWSIDRISLRNLREAKCPALMIHALEDSFIHVRQSREVFRDYGGREKSLIICEGNHNSVRSKWVLMTQLEFMLRCFDIEMDMDSMADVEIGDEEVYHFADAGDLLKDMVTGKSGN